MLNKVLLIGNLGKDPELRVSPTTQVNIVNFSLATTERRKDQSGNWSDVTEWHNIVVFGEQAKNCHTYLKKGSKVYLEGKIQTRKYQDKEGKDRYITEIVASTVQFLTPKSASEDKEAQQQQPQQTEQPESPQISFPPLFKHQSPQPQYGKTQALVTGSDPDDDIPF